MDGGFVGQALQQFGHRAVLAGEDQPGAQVREGLQDEAAEGHARVRQHEVGGVEDQLAAVEDVEVEGAWGVLFALGGASACLFERGEALEEVMRGQRRVDFDDGVEERGGAGRAVDWGGLVDLRDRRGVRAGVEGEEEVATGLEVGQPVAEIGAEGDTGLHTMRIDGRGGGGESGRFAGGAAAW